jgi:hypothetical protein
MSWWSGRELVGKEQVRLVDGGVEEQGENLEVQVKMVFSEQVGPCNLQAKGRRGLRLMCETKTGRGNARIMGWGCALFVLCPRHVYDGWDTLT